MEDKITRAARFVVDFDGTLKSAEMILKEIDAIRREISQQIAALTREMNAINGLTDYVLARRNELAHNKRIYIPDKLTLEAKQERVGAVLDAAIAIVNDDIPIFGIEDIEHQLGKGRIDLGVSYPSSVIATILTADKRFKKNDNGSYEYIGTTREKGNKRR